MYISGQIMINTGASPEEMVENIVGEGVTYSNVEFTGANISRGIFYNGSSTNIGLEGGIFLTSGSGYNIPGPNNSTSAGQNNGFPGDPQLTALSGQQTYDACVLEFDFVPESDTLRFRYVFGSEEYPEWVLNLFNDVFGYFVTGPNPTGGTYVNKNIALVPGTQLPVAIATINNVIPSYPQYYVDNTGGLTIQYDGFTTVLTAWVLVVPCVEYHIKMAAGDSGDGIYDTGVFIEENSFISPRIEVTAALDPAGVGENMIEGCVEADLVFKLPAAGWAPYTVHYEIQGTATNGVDYEPIPDSIYIPAGTDTASIHVVPLLDGITEGDEDIIIIIENTLGCTTKYDTVQFTIVDYVDIITANSGNTMICEGQEVTIWVAAINGIPPYTYQWEGFTQNNDSLLVSPTTTTTFIVHITDMCGGVATDSVTIVVMPAPQFFLGADTTLCYGASLTLHAGGGFLGYSWSTGSHDSTLVVTLPGMYWCQVTSAGGCVSKDTIMVDMYPPINLDIGADTVICIGQSITLNAGAGFIAYLWQDGSTDPSLIATLEGTYWVTVTDTNGCSATDSLHLTTDPPPYVNLGNDLTICSGETVVLDAGPGFLSYQWQNGATTQALPVTLGGWYWVIVTNTCGTTNDSIFITVQPSPVVFLGNDTVICQGQSMQLEAGTGFVSYLWQDGSTDPFYFVNQTGTYSVTVTDFFGCEGSDEIKVTISDPQVDLGDDSFFCEGQTVVLDAGGGFMHYLWQDGSSGQTYTVNLGGSYWVQVTDSSLCTAGDSIHLDKYAVPFADLGSDRELCEGDTITLKTGYGEFQYFWNGTEGIDSLTIASGGSYVVEVRNQCGSAFDTVRVDVYPIPVVYLGEDYIIYSGEVIELDGGAGFLEYLWQDGSFNRYYQVTQEGDYWVEVFDGHCKSSDSIFIEEFKIEIPNVFTPNGDGKNDKFYPGVNDKLVYKLTIFNRWGERMYESTDLNHKWDGSKGGRECSEGVYFWYFECSYGPDLVRKKTLQGSVTLLR